MQCPSDATEELTRDLSSIDAVSTVVLNKSVVVGTQFDVIEADVADQSVSAVVEAVARSEYAAEVRVTVLGVDDAQRFRFEDAQIVIVEDESIEGLGMSGASPAFRRLVRVDYQYILVMMAAAVIATVGLVADLPIAIVGAMAFSPDLGRLNAIAFALIARETRLFAHGLLSLGAGLGTAVVTSALWSSLAAIWGVDSAIDAVPESLTTFVTVVDAVTVTVALAAGVAAMIVFITDRGTAAVGVGVSITTIPAASYVGIAIAEGEWSAAGDALTVLLVNVAAVTVASVATGLVLRRHLQRRATKLTQHVRTTG
ncbi:MAG: DUF389 domain-containing protein [Acidimicrobiia bacterium]